MADYIPNSDGLMRSTLRETIKRLRRIRKKAGKEDEEEETATTGDPFQDLTNTFIRLVTHAKASIKERNDGAREHGQDRMSIEQSNEIRKDIRQMETLLQEMSQLVDKAEALYNREGKKKKPRKKKLDLLERSFNERRSQYNDCVMTLQVVREMDSERVETGKKGINATKEMQFGKKAQLRQQLLGLRQAKKQGDNGFTDLDNVEMVDNTVGGGRLEDNEETKEQMKVIAAQDAKINAGLDRLKEGVGRLKNLATEIGAQIDMQNEMLDNTEKTMDSQNKQLRSINRRLNKFMNGTKPMNCFFNVCFIILIIAVVGFCLVAFGIL